jgi:flagellar biosynthetic protein FliR
MTLDEWLVAHIQMFALILFRVLSLCMIAPIFGNQAVQARLKVGLGFFLAIVLMPLLMRVHRPALLAWSDLPLLILKECSVGFIIGLVASLVFAATHLSGQILGQHMGFGLARVIDPEMGGEMSVIAQFENMVALMLFLAISGHHLLVLAICDSFQIVPLGGVQCQADMALEIVRVTGRLFQIAIKITAPAFVILMVTTVVIGLVARFVPQMNVLIVGLPLKIAVGLIGLAACVPMFAYVFEKMLRVTTGDIYTMLDHMH